MEGARNLILNCAELKKDETLVIITEDPKLGWYEKIFVSPSNHRVHHAQNKDYVDANYGGVFILWDRFFGTYKAEKEELKPIYGTSKPLKSWNPFKANLDIFSEMLFDSTKPKSFREI